MTVLISSNVITASSRKDSTASVPKVYFKVPCDSDAAPPVRRLSSEDVRGDGELDGETEEDEVGERRVEVNC